MKAKISYKGNLTSESLGNRYYILHILSMHATLALSLTTANHNESPQCLTQISRTQQSGKDFLWSGGSSGANDFRQTLPLQRAPAWKLKQL